MSNSYTITVSKQTLQIEPGKSGSASFTVTDKTGKAMAVRAEAVFVGQGESSWLTIDGEEVRDFSADGTQQYLVKISVPASAANGTYPFKLRVYSVDDPDEYFAESSVIEVTVPKIERPEPKKSILIPVIITTVVLAAIIVGGILYLTKNKPPTAVISEPPDDIEVMAGPSNVINFDAEGSTDPEGKDLSFKWQIKRDDDRSPEQDSPPITKQVFDYDFTEPGTYKVTLIVTDASGVDSDPVTRKITVLENKPPTAVIRLTPADIEGRTVPLAVDFDAGGSTDPEGKDLSFKWQIDGNDRSSKQTFEYKFTEPGTYEVTLIVTDASGVESVPAHRTITVEGINDACEEGGAYFIKSWWDGSTEQSIALDVWGENDGMLKGGVEPQILPDGDVVFNFDPKNDPKKENNSYISVPHSELFTQLAQASGYTVSLWILWDGSFYGTNDGAVLLLKGRNKTDATFAIYIDSDASGNKILKFTQKVRFHRKRWCRPDTDGCAADDSGYRVYTVEKDITGTLTPGKWMHIAARFDNKWHEETMSICADGDCATKDPKRQGQYGCGMWNALLCQEWAIYAVVDYPNHNLLIGMEPDGGPLADQFLGKMDDIQIFLHNLRDANIKDIYKTGRDKDFICK